MNWASPPAPMPNAASPICTPRSMFLPRMTSRDDAPFQPESARTFSPLLALREEVGLEVGALPSMDLFEANRQQQLVSRAPLATRMRPRTLDELVGQEHVVGPGSLLRRAI